MQKKFRLFTFFHFRRTKVGFSHRSPIYLIKLIEPLTNLNIV